MSTDSTTVSEARCTLVFLMPSLGSAMFLSGLWSSSPVIEMASGIDGSRCSKIWCWLSSQSASFLGSFPTQGLRADYVPDPRVAEGSLALSLPSQGSQSRGEIQKAQNVV